MSISCGDPSTGTCAWPTWSALGLDAKTLAELSSELRRGDTSGYISHRHHV
jgi:hypothetical protein